MSNLPLLLSITPGNMGRVAKYCCVSEHIMNHNRASPDYCPITNINARYNTGPCADKNAHAYMYAAS